MCCHKLSIALHLQAGVLEMSTIEIAETSVLKGRLIGRASFVHNNNYRGVKSYIMQQKLPIKTQEHPCCGPSSTIPFLQYRDTTPGISSYPTNVKGLLTRSSQRVLLYLSAAQVVFILYEHLGKNRTMDRTVG